MTAQFGMFEPDRPLDGVAVDATIDAAARAGAVFVFSLSGGKDSGALSLAANLWLDEIGHPRDRRIAIHSDLGRVEWRSTPAIVEETAARIGLPLHVVRRSAGDLLARWQVRFANGKARYEALSTYNLIGPWSQANKRFCTSELKAQVIGPYLAKMFRGQTIVQVVGIRREESHGRKNAAISKPDTRFAKPGNRSGTSMMLWHPGVEWTAAEVFDCHKRHGIPLHEAYTEFGSSRLSCAFCVLASIRDLRAASSAAGNADLYRELVWMEADSTFSFQPVNWLADVAPGLLSPGLIADVARAKRDAAARVAIEAAMPGDLRYEKGWPPRAPDAAEAAAIVAARAPILRRHRLEDRFSTSRGNRSLRATARRQGWEARSMSILIDTLGSFDLISRDEANECLVRWGHRMGANNRPLFRDPIDFGLREKGELIGVATADTLIKPTCGFTRHDAFELSRLCAAAPRLSRLMLRLWTEIGYPEIVRTWGTPWAISYQNAKMHRGDLYRFDGWVRLRETRGGADPRAGEATVTANERVIWGWHASPAERARKAAEMEKLEAKRKEREAEQRRDRSRKRAA